MLTGLVATPIVLYTTPEYASVICVSTVLFIVCVEVLHRYWGLQVPFWSQQLQSTRREHETFSWASIGFLLTLLVLLWLTPVPIALAASAMLAFGDGFSALVGRAAGRHKIWYNRGKSWEGSLAGLVAGLAGALVLIHWYAAETSHVYPSRWIVVVCLLGSLFAMIGESLPRVQDNIIVPIFAAVPMTAVWMLLGLAPRWGLLPLQWLAAAPTLG
ncbi:MAG: phosphatidate cytidylyltransferase [Euryarchaeota archaeon]|nr:phosphatidate cytidylyltransferase [Euryarchaeota archaeon]